MMRPIALLLGLSLCSCATALLPPAALGHDVYFTLKNPTPRSIAALVDDCRGLAAIPDVVSLEAGIRAKDMKSERNDQLFQVALHVVFSDRAAYDRYVIHPIHRALLDKWIAKIRTVRVFDSYPGQPTQ
jgi:hypothetical protein